MKKLITISILFAVLFSTTGYAQIISVQTISDLDYMKNYYNGDNYTYKNIYVGSIDSGKVMSNSGHPNPNTDVYALTIVDAGMITIEATILNRQYNPSLAIGTLSFVSDVSGTKEYYMSDQKNSLAIEGYNGAGNYLRSIYLDPGTYYFTVGGSQYTQDSTASNYLDYVEYQITVRSQAYKQEANGDTNSSNPYTFTGSKETVSGSINMRLLYSESSGKYNTETKDRFMIPLGNQRKVKITVSNTNSNPLNIFKKEIETVRNENSKNPIMKIVTDHYRSDAALKVSMQENGQVALMPGETKEILAEIKANEDYYVEIMGSEPSEYTITYEEVGVGNETAAEKNTTTNSETGSEDTIIDSGIIMIHTACEIPQTIFDNHQYKIYLNGIDYTNSQGYMGHITNLPVCNVGDEFHVKVEVEGYEPYEETVTISPSEDNDGYTVAFVNVDTNPAAVDEGNNVESSNEAEYYVDGYQVAQGEYYDGNLAMAQLGLVMSGGDHTNGRLVNGRRDGNMVLTTEKFLLQNKIIKSSYTIYGTQYGAYTGSGVENVISGRQVTTHHSWAGTPVITSGTKLYKTIGLTDATYDIKVATGNYYGMPGSTLIIDQTGNLSTDAVKALGSPQSVFFNFTDNYGGESNYMVVHDLAIEDNGVTTQEPVEISESGIATASNWAKEEIKKSIDIGLKTEKMMNSNFKEYTTREGFCELVMKMYEKLGGRVETSSNPFVDTTNPEVIKAYNAGIINGTTTTTFSPNDSLTREQLCVMILRTINLTNQQYEFKTQFQKQYEDIDEISSWALNSVEILNGYKIINGSGASLNPKDKVTKEMAVLMLYRTYEMFQ